MTVPATIAVSRHTNVGQRCKVGVTCPQFQLLCLNHTDLWTQPYFDLTSVKFCDWIIDGCNAIVLTKICQQTDGHTERHINSWQSAQNCYNRCLETHKVKQYQPLLTQMVKNKIRVHISPVTIVTEVYVETGSRDKQNRLKTATEWGFVIHILQTGSCVSSLVHLKSLI